MNLLTLPRPRPDESAPFYHGYIAEVAGENIGEQLVSQLAELERLFSGLDDDGALARYAPGKWSIKEVLGHLTDVERIFGYRLLRIARGDGTPLPGFDQDAYVPAARFDEQPLASLLAGFRATRLSSVALFAGIPQSAWLLQGHASGHAISARALAYIIVGHAAHHLAVLRDRYRVGGSAGIASSTGSAREYR